MAKTRAEKRAEEAEKKLKAQRAKTKMAQEDAAEDLVAERRAQLTRKVLGKFGGFVGARGVGALAADGAYFGKGKVQVHKGAATAGVGYALALGSALVTKGENSASAIAEGVADAGFHVWQFESQLNATLQGRAERKAEDPGEIPAEVRTSTTVPPESVQGAPRHMGAGDDPTMRDFIEEVRRQAFEEGAQAQAAELERQLGAVPSAAAVPPMEPPPPPSQVAGADASGAIATNAAQAAADGLA